MVFRKKAKKEKPPKAKAASEPKKEPKEKKKQGGFWTRIGLPLALIAILALAAFSFFMLAALKRLAKPDTPKIPVKNTVSLAIEPEEVAAVTAKAAQTSPATAAPGSAGAPGSQAATESWPPPKPGTASDTGSSKAPGPSPKPGDAPATTSGAPQTAKVQQGWPPSPSSDSGGSPSRAAASGQPLTPAEKQDADATGLAKPRWQTVDQNWDQVKGGDAPQDLEPGDASWKQINVGQADQVKTEPSSKAVAALPPSGTTAKPPAVSPSQSTGPKTVKKKRASTKSKARSKRSRQTGRSGTSGGVRLTIINESGNPEVGQIYRNVLTSMGYRVSGIQNRPPKSGTTTILFAPGQRSKASQLAGRLPGSRTLAPMSGKSGQDLILVIR